MIKLAVMGEVKAHFRPEFINRIDEIVVFHALDEENIRAIARIQLGTLEERLAKMDYGLEVTDAALGELAKVGFDPVYGARPLKRAIQAQIENPLAKAILEGRFAPKDTIGVDWRGGKMAFEKKKQGCRLTDALTEPRKLLVVVDRSRARRRSARAAGRRASPCSPPRPAPDWASPAAAVPASRCR